MYLESSLRGRLKEGASGKGEKTDGGTKQPALIYYG